MIRRQTYLVYDVVVQWQTNFAEKIFDVVLGDKARTIRVVLEEELSQFLGARDSARFDFVANLRINSIKVAIS